MGFWTYWLLSSRVSPHPNDSIIASSISVVQIFCAHCVDLLSNQCIIVPGFIGFGALFQLVWAFGATKKVFQIQFFQGFQVWTYGVASWLGGAAVTDLLITTILVWILLNSKRGI
ncbi:hypothetical protein MJO28_008097, partial [Puccinia striiformis f. sp. tritici]